jgi:hypothetical protein
VQYARLARTEAFRQGIERLRKGAAGHRIACLCAEREPLECHRTLLVARALAEEGTEVAHIHADGHLEPHAAAMDRLLDLTGLPRDDLFRSRADLIAEALARQEEQVAYVDAKLAAEARLLPQQRRRQRSHLSSTSHLHLPKTTDGPPTTPL